ncbi:MAG: InlB B-repeat-containing protein [Eubacteriales bacterium]
MKRLKKEISWLLVVALVVSSLVLGFGQMRVGAVNATGTGIFRLDIQINSNDTGCGGNATKGTDALFRLQLLNASGGVVCATPDGAITGASTAGVGGANPLENGQTTSFTFDGAATGAQVNVVVPSLATLAVDNTITQMQLVCTNSVDDWTFNNVILYYSLDGSSTNMQACTSGGWGQTSGAVTGTWPITYFQSAAKTLTFNANGGSPNTVYSAVPGQTITSVSPTTPSFFGHTFASWSGVPTRMPTIDSTYYASWNLNYWPLTYNANGGTGGTGPTSTGYGTTLSPPAVTRTGYLLTTDANWSPPVPATMPNAAATYTANWTANPYYVVYHDNYGTGSQSITHTYDTYKTLNAGTTFSKTGYHFMSWNTQANGLGTSYASGQNVVNLTAVPAGTVDLYAIWAANNYTATYYGNKLAGTSSEIIGSTAQSSHIYNTFSPLTLNGFSRDGYIYQGWSINPLSTEAELADGQNVDQLTTIQGGDVPLYAIWSARIINVAYNNGGGVGAMATTQHTYDLARNLRKNIFTRVGYTFNGWNSALNGSGTSYTDEQSVMNLMPGAGTYTIYAQWLPIHYTITYDKNTGDIGTGTADSAHTYDVYKTLTPNGFEKVGNDFLGWNTQADGLGTSYNNTESVKNISSTNGATVTFFAVWGKLSYTIKFDANGGSNGTEGLKEFGAPLAPPVPAVELLGNTLAGWLPPVPSTVPAANTTYVAQWHPNSYWLTYDAAGGVGGIAATQTVYDTALTAPTVSKTGYTPAGWSPSVPLKMPAADSVYTMTWTNNLYTVIYNANTGSGTTLQSAHTYDVAANLTKNAFTKTGWTFMGWNSKADGTGTNYNDEQSVINLSAINGDTVTLYAKWVINQYQITFNANGGTGTYGPVTQNYDTNVTLPATGFVWPVSITGTPVRKFLGWNTTSNATTALVSYKVPATNATLYAVWGADYSTVITAINLANAQTLPANATYDPSYMVGGAMYILGGFTNLGFYDKTMFTSASRTAMTTQINLVNWNRTSDQQTTVNNYTTAITLAYNRVILSSANYATLNLLLDNAINLNRDLYTEDSLTNLDSAVTYGDNVVAAAYKAPLQSRVTTAALNLQNAFDELVYVPADYSEVNYIWANKPADMTNYTDASVANLFNYYNNDIAWDLTIDQQPTVDGYADQLILLIAALEVKPADYTDVYNAIREIPDPLTNDPGSPPLVDWSSL